MDEFLITSTFQTKITSIRNNQNPSISMDTNQTPEQQIRNNKNISGNSLTRFLDRIRRRIAFVPAVDDTVKSLKDVGIELKDNRP